MINKSIQYKWLKTFIDSSFENERHQRAKSYFQSGSITALNINNAKVSAEVEGNYNDYDVEITFNKLTQDQINQIITAIKENAEILSEIENGILSWNGIELLEKANIYLVPKTVASIESCCDCLDDKRPCKHIIAVYYTLSQKTSDNSLLLFELNGLPIKSLLEELGITQKFEIKVEKSFKEKSRERLKILLDKANNDTLKQIITELTFRSKDFGNKLKIIEENIDLIPEDVGFKDKVIFLWDKAKWRLKKIEEYGYDFDYNDSESIDIANDLYEITEELEKKKKL